MEIKVVITADANALEFSRNLKGFFENSNASEIIEKVITEAVENPVKADEVAEKAEEKPIETEVKITMKQLRAKAGELVSTEAGRIKVAQGLQMFGVGKLPELPESKFSEFWKYLNA